ncbi:MAG: hypothetical protein RR356_00455 [Bacteroidales bacterium]
MRTCCFINLYLKNRIIGMVVVGIFPAMMDGMELRLGYGLFFYKKWLLYKIILMKWSYKKLCFTKIKE